MNKLDYLCQKCIIAFGNYFLSWVPMNRYHERLEWKAKLESAYSFMLKYYRITVCIIIFFSAIGISSSSNASQLSSSSESQSRSLMLHGEISNPPSPLGGRVAPPGEVPEAPGLPRPDSPQAGPSASGGLKRPHVSDSTSFTPKHRRQSLDASIQPGPSGSGPSGSGPSGFGPSGSGPSGSGLSVSGPSGSGISGSGLSVSGPSEASASIQPTASLPRGHQEANQAQPSASASRQPSASLPRNQLANQAQPSASIRPRYAQQPLGPSGSGPSGSGLSASIRPRYPQQPLGLVEEGPSGSGPSESGLHQQRGHHGYPQRSGLTFMAAAAAAIASSR